MTLAMDLARFVVTHPADQIPEVAFERAEMIIASTLASVAVGVDIESARIIRDLEKENGGVHDATVWFDSARLPITAAAKANAVASDAAASDDSDMRSIAHIGTIVSTTAIAAAEKLGNTGREILEAMVLGYEVAGRIDESLTPGRMQKGFHGRQCLDRFWRCRRCRQTHEAGSGADGASDRDCGYIHRRHGHCGRHQLRA